MADIAFFRAEMIAERPPPPGAAGAGAWLRENLFSGPFNALLTVVSLVLIYLIGTTVASWAFQDTWSAKSLAECREIIAARHGEGHFGACWGVIRERHRQLMFGLYPTNLYWRPLLAFALLLGALAPVMVPGAPRRLLLLTAIYPFFGAWLLWGGSLWSPVAAFAGIVLAFAAFRIAAARLGPLVGAAAAILTGAVWWLFLSAPVAEAAHALAPIGVEPVISRRFGGFMLSITIGAVAIVCSLPLGILLALGRQSSLLIVRGLCIGFIEFIRGVPLITLLFVASTLLNIFMPPGTNFDIVLRVIIMVTLFASAYMAEVVRGGLAGLPLTQFEAAAALGLDYWKAQRLVIMPQALKISIPGIVSTFIGVFKDTTLVSIIGLLDPLGLSNAIRANEAWHGIVWELYGFIALVFFVFCFSMSRYSMDLERRLQTGQ